MCALRGASAWGMREALGNWQKPKPHLYFVHHEDCAFFQLGGMFPKSIQNQVFQMKRRDIGSPSKDDARSLRFSHCKQGPEIKIVGKNNVTVPACPLENLLVRGVAWPDRGPMPSLVTFPFQHANPGGRQRYIDNDLHGDAVGHIYASTSGRSISSARKVAYSSTAFISSASR